MVLFFSFFYKALISTLHVGLFFELGSKGHLKKVDHISHHRADILVKSQILLSSIFDFLWLHSYSWLNRSFKSKRRSLLLILLFLLWLIFYSWICYIPFELIWTYLIPAVDNKYHIKHKLKVRYLVKSLILKKWLAALE